MEESISLDTVVFGEEHTTNDEKNDFSGHDDCVFCMIVRGMDEDTDILKKDEEIVCFRDINPAAPHHYLVVTRRHIVSCHSLCTHAHVKLVERMAEMGRCVLKDNNVNNTKDARMGFHHPPYISVPHLHLHVLAPASQISEDMAYKYLPRSDRFITEDCLRAQLRYSLGLVQKCSTC